MDTFIEYMVKKKKTGNGPAENYRRCCGCAAADCGLWFFGNNYAPRIIFALVCGCSGSMVRCICNRIAAKHRV